MPSTPSTSSHAHGVSRKILVILALAVFLTAMALVILQNVLGSGAPSVLKSYDKGYADGFRDARAQFAGGGTSLLTVPTSSITGDVLSVSGNMLRIRMSAGVLNERVDDVILERTVTVEEGAKITKVTPVAADEYARQMAAYTPSIDTPPPSGVTSEDASLTDIKVGDVVSVNAKDGEDIRNAESFTAVSVMILVPLEMAPALEMPPIIPPPPTP